MSKAETIAKVAGCGGIATAVIGTGILDFPFNTNLGFALEMAAFSLEKRSFMMNPFGGYMEYIYSPGLINTVHHSYTLAQGFDLGMGELSMALLATAAITKGLSMAGRRMSRGRATK